MQMRVLVRAARRADDFAVRRSVTTVRSPFWSAPRDLRGFDGVGYGVQLDCPARQFRWLRQS